MEANQSGTYVAYTLVHYNSKICFCACLSRESCWLCEAMFGTWNALKKHVGGPAHARLTVICPWCPKREKTFTRLADMKYHALNVHGNEGLEDGHFGRGVGFYYAKYPEDYVKLVEEVAIYSDENACKARNIMRKWAESMVNKEDLLDKLNKGWKIDQRGRSKQREPTKKQREEAKERKDPGKAVEKRGELRPDQAGDRREKEADKGRKEDRRKRTPAPEGSKETKRRRVEDSATNETDQEEKDLQDYEDDIVLEDELSERESAHSDSEDDNSREGEMDCSGPVGLSDLRIRASKLLMQGVMPLCPPAQRDWNKVEEVVLETSFGDLVWPPKGWIKLSADQKLLAQEHMAMCLEQSRGKKGAFVQELSRRALLDKYNFLTLEGAARPKVEDGPAKTDAKARYYQYSLLCDIARGRASESRLTTSVVKCLELAERWKDTDYFTQKLDVLGLKLRM